MVRGNRVLSHGCWILGLLELLGPGVWVFSSLEADFAGRLSVEIGRCLGMLIPQWGAQAKFRLVQPVE